MQGAYNSSGVCFFRNKIVVQSSRISALFTAYISLLVLGTSSTIS